MSENNGWISVKDRKPTEDKDGFSSKVSLLVDGKKRVGYYDGYFMLWHVYAKNNKTYHLNPTHWRPLQTPKNSTHGKQ
jgi:hypothetical protein